MYIYEEGESRIFLQNLHFLANRMKTCYFWNERCGVPVGRRSGSRLATTFVATKDVFIFFFFARFFPFLRPFLIEGVLG